MVMCFPEKFLDGKGDPTNKIILPEGIIPKSAKHLIKFCVRNDVGVWVYPFANCELVAWWLESMITHRRTMYQANYCMGQNTEIKHTTFE